jgi:hypothetical protein
MNDIIGECENPCEQEPSGEAPCKTHDHSLAKDSQEEQTSRTQTLQESLINDAPKSSGGWLTILTKFAKSILKVGARNGEKVCPIS